MGKKNKVISEKKKKTAMSDKDKAFWKMVDEHNAEVANRLLSGEVPEGLMRNEDVDD